MNLISLFFLSLAMSADAFAAALGKGATLQKPRFRDALRMGVIFGCVEGLTPLIGWLVGYAALQYVEAWDHWVAFFLLLGLGLHMIYEGMKIDSSEQDKASESHSFMLLALTAVATSIDALAVGMGLAFVDVNIVLAAIMIGSATCIMVTVGVMAGRLLGRAIGRRAEVVGGVVLILIGAAIVYEHVFAA